MSDPITEVPDQPTWIEPTAARRGTWFLLATRILRGLAAGIITIAFPYLVVEELRTGALLLGVIYAGGAFSSALLAYGFGRFGSRRAMRTAYLASLVLLPTACFILLFPTSLPLAAVASVIGGFSATGSLASGGVGGIEMPLQTTILTSLTGASNRTRWFSLFTFAAGISAALGALGAGFGTIHELFAIALVLSASSFFVALAVPVRSIERGRRPSSRSSGVIRRFATTGLLNGFSAGLLTPFLVPFFILYFDIARPEMSVFTTASSTIGTFSVLAAPFLESRLGWVRAIVYTRGVAAGLAALIPFVALFPALVMYVALPTFRVAALPAQQSALMRNLPHSARAEGAGTNQATRLGAAGAATAVGGFALEDVAAPVPFLGSACILAVNAYLYTRFFGWHGERIRAAAETSSVAEPEF